MIYKRGKVYWFQFVYSGVRYRESTHVTHKRYRVSSKPLLKFYRGKVSEIDVASVERFKVARLKECSSAGVNRDLAALRYMMNLSIRQGYIESNPVNLKFLQEGPGEMRILSHDEERLYLENSPPVLKDIAILMLQTGMRPKEVYSIRKEDVHPDFVFIPKGKTRFARRTIPLTEEAVAILERRSRS